MLIVGVNTKLTRQVSRNRLADTWWMNLSPVISQLYDAGGYDMLVSTAIEEQQEGQENIAITCRCAMIEGGYHLVRLWIADDSLRGTLRLPFLSVLQDWPDVIEGFLSAHDPSEPHPMTSFTGPALPDLVWKGTR